MIGQNYKPEEPQVIAFTEGDYKLKITSAKEKTSNAGNQMIELEIITPASSLVFKYWLVENEYFNGNATKLFDCFGIQRGDFNLQRWIGKIGKGHIAKGKPKEDGKSYFEIRYLITEPKEPAKAAAYKEQYETKQANDGFKDDIPDSVPF